jgi:cell division protein FtsL
MDKLENITTEVQPTSLASAPSASPINIEILSEEVLKSLTYDQSDLFKQGKAFIGNKPVTTTSILRDILYMEVEELQITKEVDSIDRTINSKTKKALLSQIDNIISILDMSVNTKPDRIYLMIGMLLRSLYKK